MTLAEEKVFRKIGVFLMVICFCSILTSLANTVFAADTAPYNIGSTVSGIRQENEDVWYSFKVESDGLYNVYNHSKTTSNYQFGGGKGKIYDKSGHTEFFLADSGYTITEYGYSSFEQAFIEEYAVYLHKGEYLFKETGGRGINTYTFSINKASVPYGEDREPNDSFRILWCLIVGSLVLS